MAPSGTHDEDVAPPESLDTKPADHPAGKIRLAPGVRVGARTFALLGAVVVAGGISPTVHPSGSFR